MKSFLVLENGRYFKGDSFGKHAETIGEIVFSTGMTGYQETLTDPSYAGQIVVQTAPHIGITGMNDEDMESDRVWVSGYVVKQVSRIASNYRSQRTLDDDLKAHSIPGISGIDTRALTLEIRNAGAMRAGIFVAGDLEVPSQQMHDEVQKAPKMMGQSLSEQVTTPGSYVVEAIGTRLARVAVLDLGVKKSTLEHLTKRGLELVVMPASSTAEVIKAENVQGVFYSNGPGDPQASETQVLALRELLRDGMPFFGICFGNQLLGRALGFDTYKLDFGHRGINQPVKNFLTDRVEVTAHNHGFAVRLEEDRAQSPEGFGEVTVSHRDLNDNVVEGLRCEDISAFSVQYHPEAAAGPHDSHYLFDEFVAAIRSQIAKA